MVDFMIIGSKPRDDAGNGNYSRLEERIGNLESSLQNIYGRMREGNLTAEQEQRIQTVEERLENAEDLQMVANLDIIRMKENIEKLRPGADFAPPAAGAAYNISQKRIEALESNMDILRRKIEGSDFSRMQKARAGADAASGNEVMELKKEFEFFRSDTEESVKVIAGLIKKILDMMNHR